MNNKEKINEIIQFIQQQEGWTMDQLIDDIIDGNKELLRFEVNGRKLRLQQDELSVMWGDEDYIMNMNDFINEYTSDVLKSVIFMLESFRDNDDLTF